MFHKYLESWIKRIRDWGNRSILVPLFQRLIAHLSRSVAERSGQAVPENAWKTDAMNDFQAWLTSLPADYQPQASVTPDSCDLYCLFSEFIALRQEIRMQNREQHKTLKSLKGLQQDYQQIAALLEKRSRDLSTLAETIRDECETRVAERFFAVRDALIRGHDAVLAADRPPEKTRGWFRKRYRQRVSVDIEGFRQGYEIALHKFDKALTGLDIHPVPTRRQPFDARTMTALETRKTTDTPSRTVVEEVSGGFMKNDQVIRYARVVVAE